eukprot:972213-Rhodomonas_salina.1
MAGGMPIMGAAPYAAPPYGIWSAIRHTSALNRPLSRAFYVGAGRDTNVLGGGACTFHLRRGVPLRDLSPRSPLYGNAAVLHLTRAYLRDGMEEVRAALVGMVQLLGDTAGGTQGYGIAAGVWGGGGCMLGADMGEKGMGPVRTITQRQYQLGDQDTRVTRCLGMKICGEVSTS